MYQMLIKKIDKIIERAKYENKQDRERLMKNFERQDSIGKNKETLAKKYKKQNESWLDKSMEMKEYKNNSIMSTRNSMIKKITKRENSILANKQHRNDSNNSSFSRMSDSYSQKLDNVKIRLDKQYEDYEKDRVNLQYRILDRIRSISKTKNKNMLNISNSINKQIDEKMQKIFKSTEMIKKQEQKRLNEIEKRKLNQYTSYHINILKINENIQKIKQKEKIKQGNVKDNIQFLNRSFNEKQDSLYKQLSNKYKKQRENRDSFMKYDQFFHKRKLSFDRFSENSIVLNTLNKSPRGNMIKFQYMQNAKSVEKNKSLNVSRESLKESVTSSHLDLKKRLERVYSRLNIIGEDNIMRKKPEEQKEDYKEIVQKKQEIRKIKEEKEKTTKYQGGGLFATEVRF